MTEYYMPIVERMKAGQFRWEVFERNDVQVRRYGDVAVLIGVTKLKNSNPTKPSTATKPRELRFTQVWVKRKGQWQRAVFHNAWLPQS